MSDNARTLRADIADQHEDAARQARGDLIRDPGYSRGLRGRGAVPVRRYVHARYTTTCDRWREPEWHKYPCDRERCKICEHIEDEAERRKAEGEPL